MATRAGLVAMGCGGSKFSRASGGSAPQAGEAVAARAQGRFRRTRARKIRASGGGTSGPAHVGRRGHPSQNARFLGEIGSHRSVHRCSCAGGRPIRHPTRQGQGGIRNEDGAPGAAKKWYLSVFRRFLNAGAKL